MCVVVSSTTCDPRLGPSGCLTCARTRVHIMIAHKTSKKISPCRTGKSRCKMFDRKKYEEFNLNATCQSVFYHFIEITFAFNKGYFHGNIKEGKRLYQRLQIILCDLYHIFFCGEN
jgi:hypothetical protein